MVLAECIASAYRRDPVTAMDAGSSASALRDWTRYDWEKTSYDVIGRLVDEHLARDYRNPLVEDEGKNVRFDLLKCLDLYHSQELERMVRRVVDHPNRSYSRDKSQPARGHAR